MAMILYVNVPHIRRLKHDKAFLYIKSRMPLDNGGILLSL
jgi:hypothetical protein